MLSEFLENIYNCRKIAHSNIVEKNETMEKYAIEKLIPDDFQREK